jgi:hypothetical protein
MFEKKKLYSCDEMTMRDDCDKMGIIEKLYDEICSGLSLV